MTDVEGVRELSRRLRAVAKKRLLVLGAEVAAGPGLTTMALAELEDVERLVAAAERCAGLAKGLGLVE